MKSILIIAAFAVSSPATSLGQPANSVPPSQATQPQQAPKPEQRGTDDKPFSVKVVPTAEQDADSKDEKADRKIQIADERESLKYTGEQVWVGVLQGGVFLLQLIAFGAQAIYMRRSTTEMRRTIETMKETERRQLRAYIDTESANLVRAVDGTLEAKIVIKNFGQTPAYRLVSCASMVVLPFPNIFIVETEAEPPVAPFGLPPGAVVDALALLRRAITPAEDAALRAGTLAIYVVGWAAYEDVFGNHQATDFRFITGGRHGTRGDALARDSTGNRAT